MTPTEKIDAAIMDVLTAGNLLTVGFMHKYEQLDVTRSEMREAMRKIMDDSYKAGEDDGKAATPI